MGVLKFLPKFERLYQLVSRVEKCTRAQFMFDTAQIQNLVDSIFVRGAKEAAFGVDVLLVLALTAPLPILLLVIPTT